MLQVRTQKQSRGRSLQGLHSQDRLRAKTRVQGSPLYDLQEGIIPPETSNLQNGNSLKPNQVETPYTDEMAFYKSLMLI